MCSSRFLRMVPGGSGLTRHIDPARRPGGIDGTGSVPDQATGGTTQSSPAYSESRDSNPSMRSSITWLGAAPVEFSAVWPVLIIVWPANLIAALNASAGGVPGALLKALASSFG